ncbi:hypothetical protein B9Z55_000710 [Caenorhabditis nigoni]|uniref:Uncharacterized protein n=1 Tax=Caenorhabditis nigoni TaxID=1611254 RepID=A0A2G5VUF7_9PELO|nr:hypothetical protein B9Z55_000710 [Caenorhabditis nigoni]
MVLVNPSKRGGRVDRTLVPFQICEDDQLWFFGDEPTSYAPSSQQESKMKKGSKAVKTIKIREITENCKSLLFPNSEIAMLPGSICR